MPLRDGDPTYTHRGEVIRDTEKALLVKLSGVDGETWLPFSQLATWPELGDHGEIVMSRWIAEQKGLLGEEKDIEEEIPF